MTSSIPEGSHSVNAYISVADADSAINWYQENLGAELRSRLAMPDGGVMHAEIDVEGSLIMLSDASEEWGTTVPGELSDYTLCVYVDNVDAVFQKCIASGAQEEQAVEDQFWGDRSGKFRDPFGVRWMIMTHLEDVSAEEMERRFAQMMEP